MKRFSSLAGNVLGYAALGVSNLLHACNERAGVALLGSGKPY
jgi:hypothetical protein